MDDIVIREIFDDCNFKRLADDKTSADEFRTLLQEHVQGYSQKRRLSEGLKDLVKRVEEAENRLLVAKNVGKFKEPNPEDKMLTTLFSSFELKEKAEIAASELQSMIQQGQITRFERAHVLENLQMRLAKAKEAGKAKVEEKLEGMLTSVRSAGPFLLPVPNLDDFTRLEKELQAIAKLEKLSAKSLTAALQERIQSKAEVQGDFDALEESSRMWFEMQTEFKPRLDDAMREWAASEEERRKKEEEDAFREKLRLEEEALEKKRAEAEAKEMEKARMLEEKLKAKREEAALKPVKEVPQKVVKEKKTVARVDLQHMFHEEPDYEIVSAAEIQAELEAQQKAKEKEFMKEYAALIKAKKEFEASQPKAEAKQTASKPAAKKPAAPEKSYGEKHGYPDGEEVGKSSAEKQKTEEDKFKAIEEKLAAKRAEAAAKPQKEVVPEPKKKDKKAASKMSLLDFYGADQDNLLDKLAAQEAQEKAERAAKEEAEAKQKAEEDAAWWAQEQADWAEEEAAAATPHVVRPNATTSATKETPAAAKAEPAEPVAKPKPKPKRRAPVEIESKWGTPAVPAEAAVFVGEEGEEGSLLAEEAPSLAESVKKVPVKKTPPPQPKKKEKKSWGKLDASLIGFDDNNPNLYR